MIIVQLMGTDLTGGFIDVVKFNSLQARTINHINNAFVARIPEYVTTAYKKGLGHIKNPDKFPKNQIAEDIKQGGVSDGQTAQDLCSSCYGQGIGSFYEAFVESHSATEAMIFTNKPLEDSEWFNRKLQLVG
ncbi:hypothetical protein ACTFIT_012351 [Dictyostelium discoideum]